MCTLFSPEILQARAVKGLNSKTLFYRDCSLGLVKTQQIVHTMLLVRKILQGIIYRHV